MSDKSKFFHADPSASFLTRAGRSEFITGINYLPSYLFNNFWEDFREDHIRRDMKAIASMGLNAVRIPIFWDYWEPEQGTYNPDMVKVFRLFLEILKENNLYVLPWFLVGICGWLYYPDYLEGRGLLDDDLMEAEANHIKAFVTEFRDDEQILGWDLSDEPYIVTFSQDYDWNRVDPEQAQKWTSVLSQAVREVDTQRPVTMGLHGNVPQTDYGFYPEMLMDSLDLFGPGGAPGSFKIGPLDQPWATLFPAFMVQFHHSLGKPTMLSESPMYPSTYVEDDIIGRHYRSSLPTAFGAGSAGVMPWVYTDFEESEHYQCPAILRSSSEAEWGIIHADGEVKPQGKELSDFAYLMQKLDLTGMRPARSDASLVISSHYYKGLPRKGNTSGKSFQSHYGGYVLAMTAGRSWNIIREGEAPNSRISYLPGWTYADPRTLKRLLADVKTGGSALVSYGGPGVLTPLTRELFGVEVSYISGESAAESAGEIRVDDLVIPVPKCGRVVVRPTSGKVIASFSDGTPAAVINEVGEGKALLVTFPLEQLYLDIAERTAVDEVYRKFFVKLLSYLDPEPEVFVQGNAASVQVLSGKGRDLLIITNHLPRQDEVELRLKKTTGALSAVTSHTLRKTERGWSIPLAENGYAILELKES